jgi:hypothetical protein
MQSKNNVILIIARFALFDVHESQIFHQRPVVMDQQPHRHRSIDWLSFRPGWPIKKPVGENEKILNRENRPAGAK